ncbi:hypothetical protein PPERSA_04194 [Pseudocohnilembus persalinus]|uniref:Uncharacterized protein n=1 Tax=Pseudocohnilembus persalinus TaxID=266149 RepID=A0A0V0QNG4_PSEPJ|nr:hypothetical protein PPERSA_04194 [Pseudocohnilembus persalinus]|eukprot:KRX03642.1 hypothetical protein PPERSA_04194 [Pseudocohnilembus persalinus]
MSKEKKYDIENISQTKKNEEINAFKKIKHKLKLQIIKNINNEQSSKLVSSKANNIMQNNFNKRNQTEFQQNQIERLKSNSNQQIENKFQQQYQEKQEQVQGLVKEFLKAGYKANLILKMNKNLYKEYLFKIWDNNKNTDFNTIMQKNHKNIIWWQNQLIPKKYLKIITELVASISTQNIKQSNEMKSLKVYYDKMEEYIINIRRKWSYLSLKLSKNYSKQQLSTIYSMPESLCNSTSVENVIGDKQYMNNKRSQIPYNFNPVQKTKDLQINIQTNQQNQLLKSSNIHENQINIYYDNEFTDIKDDDDDESSEGQYNSESNGGSQNNSGKNKIQNYNYNFAQQIEDQNNNINSNNSNLSPLVYEKETFYFSGSFYSQFKNNSDYGNKNFSINFPKFLEIDGFIQSA